MCDGDIIFLCDQDDLWDAEKISLTVKEFEEDEHIGLVFCDAEFIYPDSSSYRRSLFEVLNFDKKKQRSFKNNLDFHTLLYLNHVIGCASAFRAKYRDVICPIPEDIPTVIHDYWIALSVAAVARAMPIPRSLIKYRQHSAQLTGYRNNLAETGRSDTRLLQRFMVKNDFGKWSRDLAIHSMKAERVNERIQTVGLKNEKVETEIADLRQKIRHYAERQRFRNANTVQEKLKGITKELVRFRYHRYSRGFRSAFKDFAF